MEFTVLWLLLTSADYSCGDVPDWILRREYHRPSDVQTTGRPKICACRNHDHCLLVHVPLHHGLHLHMVQMAELQEGEDSG